MKFMKKGQGSLEYLIIIAAVLAIAAVVILYLSGILTGTPASFAECRLKAAECASMQVAGDFNCYDTCAGGCTDNNGVDIKTGEAAAVACVSGHIDPATLELSACGLCMDGTVTGIEPI